MNRYRSGFFVNCILTLVFFLGISGTVFGKNEVKINGYAIDVKGQEPAVPQNLEPADVARIKIKSMPTGSVNIHVYKNKKQLAPGQKSASPEVSEPDDTRYKKWIVQFTGPIQEEQKKAIDDLGGRIGDYLPEFAFIVTMNNKIKTQVEHLPFVQGVVRYKPAYKIDRKLKDESGAVRVEAGKKIKLHIRLDGAENRSLVLSQVHKKKGKVLNVSGNMVRVEVEQKHIAQLSQIEEVLWIEEAVDLKLLNDTTKWVIQTNQLNNTGIWDKGLHGEGQIVGLGDSGLDYDMCYFRDPAGTPIGPMHRKVAGYTPFVDDYDGNMGHGTHVSGIVAGDQAPITGLGTANGMAPKARLYMQDLSPGEEMYVYPPADLGDLFIITYYAGARLHTNSWGGAGNWYESMGRSVDQFMWEHKDFLALFANGNAGPGEGSVGHPATAKDVVSVGATENGASAENVASFSSNGPTDDGRIKPTVTAPGVGVISADSDGIKNSNNCGTISYSGTSMATPAVAGAAALVRQYYENGYWPTGTANAADGFAPSAALVKATLINSAQNMTGDYTDAPIPSTGQGWGRINLSNALHFFGDAKYLDVSDVSTGVVTGSSWSKNYFSAGDQILKVTLVWTDYPGTEGAAKALVNDLDFSVTAPDGTTTYLGNVFQNGVSVTGGSADRLNVEEQVMIPTVQTGNYTVTVTGYNVPYGPQPFAVAVTGAAGVSSKGYIGLDKTRYNGSNTIQITVGDWDLNQNSSMAEEVSVTVKSATEPAGEVVRLVETGPNTSIFTGSIPTRLGPAIPNSGTLEVAEGDTITATYNDANDGTGTAAIATATALADLTPPVISAVTTTNIGQDGAQISWTTNEPAAATVQYGETPALGASQSVSWRTNHAIISLGNLKENKTYFYKVSSTDEAGNVGSNDNGGSLYTFTTLNLPPNLTVYSSNFSETYETDTTIYGTATDPSGVASVTVNGQTAVYRASDGYYELTVPLAIGENTLTVIATDTLGNAQTLTIAVTRYELPDLVITSLVGPAQGGVAEPIHVETTLCNSGRGPAIAMRNACNFPIPAIWIAWYLSDDTIISPSEDHDFNAYYGFGDPLLPGDCISFPLDLRVVSYPATYYLGAFVDLCDDIRESDETNNARAGNQITIGGPDLVMTAVSAPQNVGTATSFIVPNTVKNIGIGASFGFDVEIYLSTDPVITLSDLRIGRRSVGWLEPVGTPYALASESSENTVVTIPSTVPAGTYYIGAIADPYNIIKESNDANNVLTGNQITVTGPDLVMTSVSGPSTGLAGGAITVSNTVSAAPTGGGASAFSVGIYLSTDNVITTSDILIGGRGIDGLASGASSPADTTVTIPTSVAPGTYYIGAIADSYNSVAESNEANNALAGNQITITGPDLVMAAVSGPSSGLTGGTITVSNTVTASATGAAAPGFYVGVFLSTDNVITPSDTLIGYRYVAGLAPGASSTADIPVAIPANIAAGTYYIGAIADNFPLQVSDDGGYTSYVVENNAKESDETNNALAGNQITIAGPDLVMTMVSGPATVRAGQTISISNTATANGGGAGAFYVGFYLSHDSVITTSDTYLGNRLVTGLGPGAFSAADTTVTVPAGLAPGTYYIGAIADYNSQVIESNEANNSLAGNQITITVLQPDLVMTSVNGPTSAHGGDTILVNNTVAASADGGSVTSSFSVFICLSPDATIASGDLCLGDRKVSSLAAGQSSSAATTLTIPTNIAPGTYYIGAIADFYNFVMESSETNNSLAGNQIVITGPDLTMSALSYPATGVLNGTITVSNTVTNISDVASPGFSIGLYLGDIYLGSRSVSGLAAGASSSADTTATIPSYLGDDEFGDPIYLTPGTYTITAIADNGSSVGESNETNNARVGGPIVITNP
jgi:subtilase family serine protease